ncbi:hypothetical protein HK098_007563, partial [Nowakowskiella sp. JEL0407]
MTAQFSEKLSPFILKNTPPDCTIIYIPNFFHFIRLSNSTNADSDVPIVDPSREIIESSEFETQHLLRKIFDVPIYKWTTLKRRRLQTWGATPFTNTTSSQSSQKNIILDESLPQFLQPIASHLASLGVFNPSHLSSKDTKSPLAPNSPPNNCLINEYLPGQGIFPHDDGPKYHTTVATVSLGGSCKIDFYRKHNIDSVPQEMNSETTETNGEI